MVANPSPRSHSDDHSPLDKAQLAAVFERERSRLAKRVRFRLNRRLAGRVDVEDILQEAYLSAEQRLDHYLADPSWPITYWIRLIVDQTTAAIHRRHLNAQARDARREQSLRARRSNPLVARQTTPSQVAIRRESAAHVRKLIKRMKVNDREILTLRHFEGLSNSEAAGVLGVTEKVASRRYFRALLRLTRLLAEQSDEQRN